MDDSEALLNFPGKVMIAGDLNAKHYSWNSRTNNTTGFKLFQCIGDKNDVFISAPTTPARYPTDSRHNPDILDIAILKIAHINRHITNRPYELSSDPIRQSYLIYFPILPKLHLQNLSWQLIGENSQFNLQI